MTELKKIKVLIVDDSALVRGILTELLSQAKDIEVVGGAADPHIAREKIKQLNPDVITLDVEMPRMDGITFLGHLMRLRPLPVVMISSLTERGADVTLQALELGAIDFVSKPRLDVARGLADQEQEIIEKVRGAAMAKLRPRPVLAPGIIPAKMTADAVLASRGFSSNYKTTDRILAIGASTGGTEAIREVLEALPADAPGTVIAQHIPKAFSGPFAKRMNESSKMTVVEASHGEQILPGHVYIAPGDRHLIVERSGARFVCHLSDGPAVNRHRPSVDVLFRSVANSAGASSVAAILTGMGEDGARGLLELKNAGAKTFAQDEASSVVWGMPGSAVRLGAADKVLPLDEIAAALLMAASASR